MGTKGLFVLLVGFSLVFNPGCTKSTTSTSDLVGDWVRRSDFEGVTRTEAVGIACSNGKAYAGLGFDGTNRLSDFWEYDPENDQWLKKAPFPGGARNSAVGFSANGKVYVGLGSSDGINYLSDFWEYSPDTDEWKQVADFAGGPRTGAVAFAIADKGYICSGYDGNYLKDFWQYDPVGNTWAQKASPNGSKRNDAVAFVIDNKAYLCTGVNNGTFVSDFYVYDADTEKWTAKREISALNADESYDDIYTTITRSNAVAFTINGKGYVTTGIKAGYVSDTWEYDPATDLWVAKTTFEGAGREGAIGFSLNNRGFVGLGKSSSLRFDDMFEFLPAATYVQNN